MKTIAIIGLLSLSAAGAYAQGTINFFNDFPGKLVTEIFFPATGYTPTVSTFGNQSTDIPAGTQVYTGTPIGGSSGPAGASVNYATFW